MTRLPKICAIITYFALQTAGDPTVVWKVNNAYPWYIAPPVYNDQGIVATCCGFAITADDLSDHFASTDHNAMDTAHQCWPPDNTYKGVQTLLTSTGDFEKAPDGHHPVINIPCKYRSDAAGEMYCCYSQAFIRRDNGSPQTSFSRWCSDSATKGLAQLCPQWYS